jgi:hypothetical protein
MSHCPIGETSGFIQLTGAIPYPILKTISKYDTAPIQMAFGARTTPAGLAGNQINDTTGSTCIYNTKTYTMMDIRITKPVHTGYTLPSIPAAPSLEMIVTFSGSGELAGLLLCVPIFDTGSSKNDAYLSQLNTQITDVSAVATLDSVFLKQPSFGYRTCFETITAQQSKSHSLYVLVFPHGIQLRQSTYTALATAIGTPVQYGIPPGLRNGGKTVYGYTTIDQHGNKTSPTLSNDGYIATTPIATCDDIFMNTFEYYPKGPTTVSTRKVTSTGSVRLHSTSQYKCAPFDQSRVVVDKDNNTIYVTPHADDPTLQAKVAANNTAVTGNKSPELNAKELATYIGIGGAGVVVTCLVIAAVYYMINSNTEDN